MKTHVILASCLMAATMAWGQEEEAAAPPATDLPPAESLPSLEEMSRMDDGESTSEETPPEVPAEAPAPDGQPAPAEGVPSELETTTQDSTPATEEPAPAAGQPTPAEAAPATTAEPESSSATSSNSSVNKTAPGRYGSDFGSFRVGLGAGRPTFDEKVVKYYDDLYGKPRLHPDIFLDYYFFDWYLTLGVGARLRYYRTEGYAAQTSSPVGDTLSDDEIDRSSDVELVLVPLQAVITAEITPWRTSFFTLNAWTGVERMYVQETRHPKEEAASALTFATDEDAAATYVSRGWNTASVVGASVSLRLDYFDRASVNSLDIMGFRSVFLTPYMEIAKTQKGDMGKWDRRELGLLFTFESIR